MGFLGMIYRRLVGVQMRSQLQYRFSFVMDIVSTIFMSVVEFGSLALVLQRFEGIAGWGLGELAFLYAMVEISFSLMDMLFSGFDPPHFSEMVRRGTLDQLLLRPLPLMVQVLGSRVIFRRLGRTVQGVGVFAVAVALAQPEWTVGKVLYLPIVVASLIAFFASINIIGASLTFWTVQSFEAINIFSYGSSFMMSYPMHIYEQWLRRFATYILPAIFLNYYPALFFLDKQDPYGMPWFAPFLAPLCASVLLGIALASWRYGIRHYQSTGS